MDGYNEWYLDDPAWFVTYVDCRPVWKHHHCRLVHASVDLTVDASDGCFMTVPSHGGRSNLSARPASLGCQVPE